MIFLFQNAKNIGINFLENNKVIFFSKSVGYLKLKLYICNVFKIVTITNMLSSQEISSKLSEFEIKPSFQRIKIYEFLIMNNTHPTVDTIFNNLSDIIPTLSRTTVYNTLKLFEKANLISSVNINEKEIRYDAIKKVHGHFICEECGHIYDFDYDFEKLKHIGLSNFNIRQTDLNIKGICPKCNK